MGGFRVGVGRVPVMGVPGGWRVASEGGIRGGWGGGSAGIRGVPVMGGWGGGGGLEGCQGRAVSGWGWGVGGVPGKG